MFELLFKKFNHHRKEKIFQNPLFTSKKKYACIGVGIHSLTNIYPVLRHYNIQIKYVYTLSSNWSKEMNVLFPGTIFTNDLSVILKDDETDGVFVCASPDSHFSLLQLLFKAGKKVFVEKPPCSSLQQLNELCTLSKEGICKVGLQRRYWPGNKHLLKKTSNASSYIYQFYFGPFHAGNVINDLFIHAIDYINFLFGECDIMSHSLQQNPQGITIQLHVKHIGGTAGMIELSTHYSWNDPIDNMNIQCNNELLTVQYPVLISGVQKPKRILNIPSERLYQQPGITKKYFAGNNLVMPVFESNTLFLQGFYGEMESFIKLVESGKSTVAENDLIGLQPVYKILDQLNGFVQRTASL